MVSIRFSGFILARSFWARSRSISGRSLWVSIIGTARWSALARARKWSADWAAAGCQRKASERR